MLEEKNDNLQDADGNQENDLQSHVSDQDQAKPQDIAADESVKSVDENSTSGDVIISDQELAEEIEPLDTFFAAESKENEEVPEDLITESPDAESVSSELDQSPVALDDTLAENIEQSDPIIEKSEFIDTVIPEEELLPQSNDKLENEDAMASIENSNAEEREDESLAGRHDIPMQDYEKLTMEALVDELETLVGNERVMSVRDHVEEIKRSFLSQFNHLRDEKREDFLADNPEGGDDFHFNFPLKARFDQLYSKYRDRKNAHFKSLQNNLQTNLENRLAIVEELKNLINPQENIKDTLKHFNDLRDRWKNAGPIPKDKYNHVWNNYHFHVENFYDYLHLDREARDLDFKHNLEQKQKIIARVEELVNEADVNKAFRELQDLHRMWKEEIGPVSKEYREDIWLRFSELTKQLHDKREAIFEKQRGTEQENLEKKKDIISRIEVLAQEKVGSHAAWLQQIEKVEALRNEFFSAGKVPSDANEETWAAFKTAVRNFNSLKNSFYKDIKKDQNDNLSRKMALVAKAKELQESTDFAATTPIMKQIQEEWKGIGHVPRKYSDSLWKDFKAACNHYFEKLKEQKNEENSEEIQAFEKKKEYLESLKEFQLVGDHKTDLDGIKAHIENWKSFGRVPMNRRHIEGKFNKILDALFDKLSLSKKESDMMRFSNKIEQLSGSNDTRKLDNEKIFLMRKIDEVQSEIFQLENNIQFFAHAKKDNPMVLEVKKNIQKHKEELDILKSKLKQLRSLNQE